MPKVFLSYRKVDAQWLRERVYEAAVGRFGADAVFKARESITPGADYAKVLLRQAAECKLMLALIGPGWFDAVDDQGRRRLFRDGDWVRQELATAFANGNRVVPVLLGDTVMLPKREWLPPDIADLAGLQFLRVPDTHPDAGLAAFVEQLARLFPSLVAADGASPADTGPDAGADTASIAAAAAVAAQGGRYYHQSSTGKYSNNVIAETGANVKIVQKVRRWAAANPALAVTTVVALLGSGSVATAIAFSTGDGLSSGDSKLCQAASSGTSQDVWEVAPLVTNADLKQQAARIRITSSDAVVADATAQIRKLCSAAGWRATGQTPVNAGQLVPRSPQPSYRTAASPSGPAPTHGSAPATSSTTSVYYSGPELPGLAATPIWSIGSDYADMWTLGTSFVTSGQSDANGTYVLTFRAAADGSTRATVTITNPTNASSNVGDYNGKPVLYVATTRTTVSDGLSQPVTYDVYNGYDEYGKVAVHGEHPEDRSSINSPNTTWVDGFWCTTGRDGLTVADATGKTLFTDPNSSGTPTIANGYAFVRRSSHSSAPDDYDVYNLAASSAPAWKALAASPGVADGMSIGGEFTIVGDKVVLWWHSSSRDSLQLTVHDLATGRLLALAPSVDWPAPGEDSHNFSIVYDARTDALMFNGGDVGTQGVSVELSTGKILWHQTSGEYPFQPVRDVGGAIYGNVADGSGNGFNSHLIELAIDPSGHVLAKNLNGGPLAVSQDGYAIVDGLVFKAQ